MEKKQQQFSLWYFMAVFLLNITLQNFFFAPSVENLLYSDFKTLLKAGKVNDLILSERVISGTLKKLMNVNQQNNNSSTLPSSFLCGSRNAGCREWMMRDSHR